MPRSLYFPFQVSDLGLPRTAPRSTAIRQQLEQLLFTMPKERVNRPDFGIGVQRLVFAGASPETAAATEYVIGVSIRKFMGDVVRLDGVRVTVEDATLFIDILYAELDTGAEQVESFSRPLEGTP